MSIPSRGVNKPKMPQRVKFTRTIADAKRSGISCDPVSPVWRSISFSSHWCNYAAHNTLQRLYSPHETRAWQEKQLPPQSLSVIGIEHQKHPDERLKFTSLLVSLRPPETSPGQVLHLFRRHDVCTFLFWNFLKEEYRHDKQNSHCGVCYSFAAWFLGLLFLQKGSVRDTALIDNRGSASGTINHDRIS